jgi:hypothetical protein
MFYTCCHAYGFPPETCGNDKTRTVIPDIFCRVSSIVFWIPNRAALVRNDLVVVDSCLVTRLKTGGRRPMTYGFPPGNCGNDKIVVDSRKCSLISVCKPGGGGQWLELGQSLSCPVCRTVLCSLQFDIARIQPDHLSTVLQNAEDFCIPRSGRLASLEYVFEPADPVFSIAVRQCR